jgi:uncharacterized protein (DUF1501 family)
MGLGGSTLLACGAAVPAFLARTASTYADLPKRKGSGKILVVVQLEGGNDGLNTVVPQGDDVYQRSRPKLALGAKDLRPIDGHVSFHPALEGFARLRDDGKLAIVQSVGYPNPNRSHFESGAIWQTGRVDPTGRQRAGWLARAMDETIRPEGGDVPAFHVGNEETPQALRGGQRPVSSMSNLEEFRRRLGVSAADGEAGQRAALGGIAERASLSDDPLLQFVARSAVTSYASTARLERIADDTGARYPEYELARRLRLIARLIRAEMATPIYYTQLGGFDTHADQLNTHYGRLNELGSSLRAFQGDLDRTGLADRVVILVFSEFGRRLKENASAGTDHGTAAPVFLIGKAVQGGLHGPYPDLNRLDQEGDPIHAIDFRRIYATLLESWLGLHPENVLGASFETMPLLKPKV